MTLTRFIHNELCESLQIHEGFGCVIVTTHCIYPSGGFVQVSVQGNQDTFVVSDASAAVREVEAAGANLENYDKILISIVKSFGLKIYKGEIRSPQVNGAGLACAIAIVANASQQAATWLFSHLKVKPNSSFKDVVSDFLRQKYAGSISPHIIIGQSNKAHRFDNTISLGDGKTLIVDPVAHDANSINARLVANMDIRAANNREYVQRIVYDDRENWTAAEINLLQLGAPAVKFSNASDVIDRALAA